MLSLLIAALLPLDISSHESASIPKQTPKLRKQGAGEYSKTTVMNPLLNDVRRGEARRRGGDRDFVMCTVNQPSNDWEMIREYIVDDTPFVLAVQDYNPKRDGAILKKEESVSGAPFHGKVVSSHVLTRGTVAVMASPLFLEKYDSLPHVMLGDNTPTTVKGTVK